MSFFFVRLLVCQEETHTWGHATHPTQSANSFVFGTVAESKMMLTCSGNMMMTSSHTTPRYECIRKPKV